ncbi:EVE domain-containing protein [Devosia sp.]|uniref:EVE domain-containing protein n=1 Tax=Devosia sp. TaxID=1871048 RepID=UPI003262CE93
MTRYWIGVASADHVRGGRAGGFMQLGHGKSAPLKRLHPGDGIVYYSPSTEYGKSDGLQAFTAIGVVRPGEIYAGNMGADFQPNRRDVDWAGDTQEVSIRGLLEQLELTRGLQHWGGKFRFGLVEISAADFAVIGAAMGAKP